MTHPEPSVRAKAWGDVTLGSLVVGSFMVLTSNDNIQFTGGGPPAYDERQKWETVEDKQPFSWRVKDENGQWGNWSSYRQAEPFATILGFMADYREIQGALSQEERDRLGSMLVLELAFQATSGLLGKTWFQGFEDLFQSIEGLTAHGLRDRPNRTNPVKKWIAIQAASFIPYSSALKGVGRRGDPVRRTKEVGGFGIALQEEFKAVIPGWGRGSPIQRNPITGKALTSGGRMEPAPGEYAPWYEYIADMGPQSMLRSWKSSNDPVLKELAYLNSRGTRIPLPRRGMFSVSGRIQANHLTPRQWAKYVELRTSLKLRMPNGRLGTLREALAYNMSLKDYRGSEAKGDDPTRSQVLEDKRLKRLNKVFEKYDRHARELFFETEEGKAIGQRLRAFELLSKYESESTVGLPKNVVDSRRDALERLRGIAAGQ